MARFLLDASAVLALMSGESGSERVAELLLRDEAAITTTNLAEVATKLVARGLRPAEAESACRSMALRTIALDDETAFDAAALWPVAQPLGLSLGDRICLATAARQGWVAVTADRAWSKLQGLKVELIR
jgi:PIN domain nuclease of toxin-antitoxin system